jgi:hypothetical protein
VPSEADRWGLRAAIDAVVAHEYGVSRTEYERIVASFSHKSFAGAPALCLAAFDEFTAKGLDQFCRDYDPYSDIPRVTVLAQPVIRLPVLATKQHTLLPAGIGPEPTEGVSRRQTTRGKPWRQSRKASISS